MINEKLHVEECSLGDILPITGSQKPDSTVFIILNGKILLRDHQLNDPFNYNVM